MIEIKANRLDLNAWHTSQQPAEYLLGVLGDARLQNPSAILAHPHDVVFEIESAMTGRAVFHVRIVSPQDSFNPG